MSNTVIIVNKKVGQTPFECINEAKVKDPLLSKVPVTYAGRLDPLAEGVLILLTGEECLKKDEYLALSKEYEVDVLFGFSTDTYDVMGKVLKDGSPSVVESSLVSDAITHFTGYFDQPYPPYSSRPVNGKPLFQWAREGNLDKIDIPIRKVCINKIEIIKEYTILGSDLLLHIQDVVNAVSGDFRQKEILSIWKEKISGKEDEYFSIFRLRVDCESGVYVRSVANGIGEKIGTPSLAFKIVRTRIGEYTRDTL